MVSGEQELIPAVTEKEVAYAPDRSLCGNIFFKWLHFKYSYLFSPQTDIHVHLLCDTSLKEAICKWSSLLSDDSDTQVSYWEDPELSWVKWSRLAASSADSK